MQVFSPVIIPMIDGNDLYRADTSSVSSTCCRGHYRSILRKGIVNSGMTVIVHASPTIVRLSVVSIVDPIVKTTKRPE